MAEEPEKRLRTLDTMMVELAVVAALLVLAVTAILLRSLPVGD